MLHYINTHPELLDYPENQFLLHEDYLTSHAFEQATNGTGHRIGNKGFYERSGWHLVSEEKLTQKPIYFIHAVKTAEEFYFLHDHFYDKEGKLKEQLSRKMLNRT